MHAFEKSPRRRRRLRSSLVAGLVALITPLVAVAAPTASAAPSIDHYVALGDSYAAGAGIPNQVGTPPGCMRSDVNYASLVTRAEGIGTLVDVTCGGATSANLTAPQETADGVAPPQLDSLTADADLVTLQFGGNDIGFAEIMLTCVGLSFAAPLGAPCKGVYTAGGTDELRKRIAATAPKIAAAIQAIHAKAPRAKIIVVGYIALVPDKGYGCWPVVPIAFGDVPYLRGTEKALNAMLAQQAAANGATYVDVYTPSIGHDSCQSSGRWVEGVNLATPFHPNAAGHIGMAAVVEAAL